MCLRCGCGQLANKHGTPDAITIKNENAKPSTELALGISKVSNATGRRSRSGRAR